MLSADELVELRALQARAYGREGGLSDADAERMRQLEIQRMPASSADQGVSSRSARSTTGDVDVVLSRIPDEVRFPPRIEQRRAEDATESPVLVTPTAADVATAPEDSSTRGTLRRFWRPLAAVAAALLLLGLAAGWAIFGQRSEAIALTEDQVQRRLELYDKGNYDEGTVRAVGLDEDVLVWYGTRKDGDLACIVLDVKAQSSEACQPIDLARDHGVGVSIMNFSEDESIENGESIGATVFLSTTGEPVATIQRWSSGANDWLNQFEGAERVRAAELVEEGYVGYSTTIIGSFRDAPVWSAVKESAAGPENCLIVDAVEASQCKSFEEALAEGLGVQFVDVDAATGATSSLWMIEIRYTRHQTPFLTITADAGELLTVKPGDRVEVGGEHGDPIEVGTDVPQG